MTKLGESLLEGISQARIIARNENNVAHIVLIEKPDVASIRKKLGLSQEKFAERFNLPKGSVRDWEQGRRTPDAAARNLLRVIKYAPETVERALSAR